MSANYLDHIAAYLTGCRRVGHSTHPSRQGADGICVGLPVGATVGMGGSDGGFAEQFINCCTADVLTLASSSVKLLCQTTAINHQYSSQTSVR